MTGNRAGGGTSPLAEFVDFEWLERYSGGDPAFELELFELFEMQAMDQLGRLTALAGTGDLAAWHLASHTLKGTARSIGINEISSRAQRLEDAGPLAVDNMMQALLGELATLLKQFQIALAEHRGNDLK